MKSKSNKSKSLDERIEKELQMPYSLRQEEDRKSIERFERKLDSKTRAKARREGKLDPEFAVKLRKIKRLHRAIRGMQTDGLLLDKGEIRAEIKRLSKRDGIDETKMALLFYARMLANSNIDNLPKEQVEARIPLIWARLWIEHQERILELDYLMKSLTPEQRKYLVTTDRKRLLSQERRKKKTDTTEG